MNPARVKLQPSRVFKELTGWVMAQLVANHRT